LLSKYSTTFSAEVFPLSNEAYVDIIDFPQAIGCFHRRKLSEKATYHAFNSKGILEIRTIGTVSMFSIKKLLRSVVLYCEIVTEDLNTKVGMFENSR
jgi:hypothetical protein